MWKCLVEPYRGSILDVFRIIKLQTEIKHNFGEDESLRFVHVEFPSKLLSIC
jgi:hypothetical protein